MKSKLINTHQMNGYILTGGLSKRFGTDKAIYMINGITFIDKVYNALQNDFNQIFSVGKKNFSKRMDFVPDFSDSQAAIVGVITALRHTSSKWNFIISVDTPYISSNIISSLQRETTFINNRIIIPSVNGRILPLSGFYHQNCLAHFEAAYSAQRYKIIDIISSLKPIIVNLSHYSKQLSNINTPKQIDWRI